MEPIADVAALQPVIQSLIDKGLVIALTPPGRGQVISHALLLPEELDKVQAGASRLAGADGKVATEEHEATPTSTPGGPPPAATTRAVSAEAPRPPARAAGEDLQGLLAELDELKAEVARLKHDVQDLWANLG